MLALDVGFWIVFLLCGAYTLGLYLRGCHAWAPLSSKCLRERFSMLGAYAGCLGKIMLTYGTNRMCTLVAQEPLCQTKHDQAFDLKNQCVPIASTNKLQTSTVAMPLQFMFLVFPGFCKQVSSTTTIYKPKLSFPKTLE